MVTPRIYGMKNILPSIAAKLSSSSQLFHVLLCLLLIMIVSRLLHLVLRYAYQPMVISEMLAGIIIGPSLLGFFSQRFTTT